MEKKIETTGIIRITRIIGLFIGFIQGIYWGYIGLMENKMETVI